MEDPLFKADINVGGDDTSYKFQGFPDEVHANQSFILQATLSKDNGTAQYDISTATGTLYVVGYKDSIIPITILTAAAFSDSGAFGGGTTDRATFTVPKDVIPEVLGTLPLRNPGNAVFYFILEDGDSVLQFFQQVNVLDTNYTLTNDASPGPNTIVVDKNDLGTVESVTTTAPPAADLNVAYVVAPGATGVWALQDNNLAIGNGLDWIFSTPEEGNFVYVLDDPGHKVFDSSLWIDLLPPDDSITNAKLSNVAQDTIKGRITAGAGDPEDLTATQARTVLNVGDGAQVVTVAAGANITVDATDPANPIVAASGGVGDMLISTYDPATVSEQLVGLTAAQALTNKSVNGVTLNSAGGGVARLKDDGTYTNVTPAEVGNGTAQWNANKVQGNDVEAFTAGAPDDAKVLTWVDANSRFELLTPPGAGGGEVNTLALAPGATGLDPTEPKSGLELRTKGFTSGNGVTQAIVGDDIQTTGITATDSQIGVVELATDAETATGTAIDRALTPASAASHYAPRSIAPDIKGTGPYTTTDADNGKWIIVDDTVTLHVAGSAGINILITNSTGSAIAFVTAGLTVKGTTDTNISSEKSLSVKYSQTTEVYLDGATE